MKQRSTATIRSEMRSVLLAILTLALFTNLDGHASVSRVQGGRNMESLRGKTLRWTLTDGPMAGTLFEHTFYDDGRVEWRILEGPGKGAIEKRETIRRDAGVLPPDQVEHECDIHINDWNRLVRDSDYLPNCLRILDSTKHEIRDIGSRD
jgi:hypothetical protein